MCDNVDVPCGVAESNSSFKNALLCLVLQQLFKVGRARAAAGRSAGGGGWGTGQGRLKAGGERDSHWCCHIPHLPEAAGVEGILA